METLYIYIIGNFGSRTFINGDFDNLKMENVRG